MRGFITLIITSISLLTLSQVTVIHFNSDWNSENSYNISSLKDCAIDSVVICNSPDMQEEHNIKYVPTVIVFDSGLEAARFEGNLLMKLTVEIKNIQKAIDKIYLSKFE